MWSSLSSFVDYHSEENRKVDGKRGRGREGGGGRERERQTDRQTERKRERETESKEIQKLTALDYTIYTLLIEFQADIYFINNIITNSRQCPHY